jgi:hypothetical protein
MLGSVRRLYHLVTSAPPYGKSGPVAAEAGATTDPRRVKVNTRVRKIDARRMGLLQGGGQS